MAKARGCTVILCGADATDHSLKYFARGADYVLLGEGEADAGRAAGPPGRPRRTGRWRTSWAWPGRTGSAASTATRAGPTSATSTRCRSPPGTWWTCRATSELWRERHGYYSMNMVTTRGCPYHCNWCAKPIWGQRYNSRSPENVAAELKWLKETYQPDHIWFADDILGLKPGWLERFAAAGAGQRRSAALQVPEPRRPGDRVRGGGAGRGRLPDRLDWGRVRLAENPRRDGEGRRRWPRSTRPPAGCAPPASQVGFFLQFGYPGETWDDIQLTLKMVRECLPDDIGISVSYPLPGTRFYERVKLELGEKQNWVDSSDLAMLYQGPFPQEFYRVLHSRVHHEFRLRRALAARPARRGGAAQRLRAVAAVPRHALGWLRAERRLRAIARHSAASELTVKFS